MTQLLQETALRYDIRQFIRAQRRALCSEQKMHLAQNAATRMMTYPPVMKAHTVALFLSFDGELNTQPLIDRLWQTGKFVYLPVLNPAISENLLFLYYHPQSKLVINRLKIREPKFNVKDVISLSDLDVLVVPLVAFDKKGHRLGMGGGFYDRTLRNHSQYGLQLVGYAYDCQFVKALPIREWDVSIPAVVTPSKLWKW